MVKHVRPPTVRDLGTKVRSLKPFTTTAKVVDELLSTAKGLPAEDEASGLVRLTLGGVVKPVKSTASMDTIKIKLQDTAHVKALYRLDERAPTRGMGAARLILPKGKERLGSKGKMVAMAAGPVRIKAAIPKGKAALRRLPMIKMSHNVVTKPSS